MSQETDVKEQELKKLSKELIQKQADEARKFITFATNEIARLTQQINQQAGVAGFADHLLKTFDIPSIPEEKKTIVPEVQ